MKTSLILLACCFISYQTYAQATPHYKVNDLVKNGLKGDVKAMSIKFYDSATRNNNGWQPVEPGTYNMMTRYFNRKGFIDSTVVQKFESGKQTVRIRSEYLYTRDSLTGIVRYYTTGRSVTRIENPNATKRVEKDLAVSGKPQNITTITYNDQYLAATEEMVYYDTDGKTEYEQKASFTYDGDIRKVLLATPTETITNTSEITKRDAKGNATQDITWTNDPADVRLNISSYQYY